MGLLLGVLSLAFTFRPYRARVMVEVTEEPSSARGHPTFPRFVEGQMQAIPMPEILRPVVENLGLDKVLTATGRQLSVSEAIARLARSLEIGEVRDTGLIEIGVYHGDPQLAANIANTIAVVFVGKRHRELQSDFDRSFVDFREEIQKLRRQTEQAGLEMDQMRELGGIVDPDPMDKDAVLTVGTGDLGEYCKAKSRYVLSARILDGAQTRLSAEMLEGGIDFNPARIVENAEPPRERGPFRFRRFW